MLEKLKSLFLDYNKQIVHLDAKGLYTNVTVREAKNCSMRTLLVRLGSRDPKVRNEKFINASGYMRSI